MAVETHVVTTAVVAGVADVVLQRRLAALAGGPMAGPLSSVTEARRRRPVQVVVAGVFRLDDRRASGRQSGASIGMEFSTGTRSASDLAIASRIAATSACAASACAASASARSDAALASSFLGFRLRLRGGDEVRAPSRMTRAPLLCLGNTNGSSYFTVLGVDADDRDADLEADPEDADPEDRDAIRRGIHELPRRRDGVDGCGGGIRRIGEFPRLMCARMASRVRPGALHQRRRPAALLRIGGGGWPSYAVSSRSYLCQKNVFHAG
jgi:hypothetical protein